MFILLNALVAQIVGNNGSTTLSRETPLYTRFPTVLRVPITGTMESKVTTYLSKNNHILKRDTGINWPVILSLQVI